MKKSGKHRKSMIKNSSVTVAVLLVTLLGVTLVYAADQSTMHMGTTESFRILGGQTVTNTGETIINGDLGVSPGSAITGFPPGIVNEGVIHAADAVALQAQSDTTTLYNSLAGQACDTDLTNQDLGGLTLTPGVYCFSTSAQLTGTLTLDAQGDADAIFIFQTGSTLTTASESSILLINDASPCNIFWQIGSSATIGTDSELSGSIIALTSITFDTDANLEGRALARNGAVTLDSNKVDLSCTSEDIGNIPEFGVIAGAVALVGALGIFVYRRK